MSRRLALILFLFISATGIVVRCQGVAERTLSFDEAFSWRLVTAFPIPEVVRRTATDVHPPLYYLLLKGWILVWGDGAVALRSLSIMMACASFPVIYGFSRDVYRWSARVEDEASSRATGIIATLLLATSGAHIRWSGEARMYSLACLLGLISTWLLARCTLESSGSRRTRICLWCLYGFSTWLCLYTHNYMIFVVMGQSVWLVISGITSGSDLHDIRGMRRRSFTGLIVLGLAVLSFGPWVPVLIWQAAQVKNDYWFTRPPPLDIARCWADLVIPRNNIFWGDGWLALGIGAFSALIIIWLGLAGRRGGALITTIIVFSTLVPITITSYGTAIVSYQTSRYWLVAFVFLIVAISVLLSRSLSGFERWIFALVLVANQIYFWAEFHRQTRLDLMGGAKALAEYVRSHGEPDELVIVREPSVYLRVLYHMRHDPLPDRVQLLPRKALDSYNGGPVITEAEIKDESILDPWANRKVWAVDGATLVMLLEEARLPGLWAPVGRSEVFSEPILNHGKLALTENVRQEPDHRPITYIYNP